MSKKRQATTELNHDNWNTESPEEHEEMGSFKAAPKEVLEKRIVRTAKRRTQVSGDESKKSVFSGFEGFNKAQSTSFDFLANLTNGNKNDNGIPTKTEAFVTSSLFTSKPPTSSPGGNFGTSPSPLKISFGTIPSQTSALFGTTNTCTASSVFTSKADSTVNDSPFKTQPVSSSGDTSNSGITKVTNASTIITTPQVTSTIFGTSNATTPNKSVSSTTNSSPFKAQSILNNSMGVNAAMTASSVSDTENKKNEEKGEEKKLQYYSKLKGLNESVLDWIKKHVEETPLCILTPIFKDYEKYLKEIKPEYKSPVNKETNDKSCDKNKPELMKTTESITLDKTSSVFASGNNSLTGGTSLFKAESLKQSMFAPSVNNLLGQKTTGFSFGINNSSANIPLVPASTCSGFSFGVKPTPTLSNPTITLTPSNTATAVEVEPLKIATTSTPLSFSTETNTPANGATSFSFGIGKPFSFGSNISSKVENTVTKNEDKEAQEDDETPPKMEKWIPIAEENSVFDKRCKIFVKKDTNFVDKGVGTLYIKKIEDSEKHQLLVRANTSMGNVLLNLRLSSTIPTQRMGKNNVMIVCIPTPDFKPPPIPVLIRVKTSEEADELLGVFEKYKT